MKDVGEYKATVAANFVK
jgi:NEDD8-activating enzyme E1